MKHVITLAANGTVESIEEVRLVKVRRHLFTVTTLALNNYGQLVLLREDVYKTEVKEMRKEVFNTRFQLN